MSILLFKSIHDVMKAEKALKRAGVPVGLVPTPKEYSRQCGMSIELSGGDYEKAKTALAGIEHEMISRESTDTQAVWPKPIASK